MATRTKKNETPVMEPVVDNVDHQENNDLPLEGVEHSDEVELNESSEEPTAENSEEDEVAEAEAKIEELIAAPIDLDEEARKLISKLPKKVADRKQFRRTMRQFSERYKLGYQMINSFYVFPTFAVGQDEQGNTIVLPPQGIENAPAAKGRTSGNRSNTGRKRKSVNQGFTYKTGHQPVSGATLEKFRAEVEDELSGPYEFDELNADLAYYAIPLVALGNVSNWDAKESTEILRTKLEAIDLEGMFDSPLSFTIHEDLILFGRMKTHGDHNLDGDLNDDDSEE